MTQPYNWSERVEPNSSTGLKDCTYAAGLTGMVYAGFGPFPLGIYTVAEREALERSDDQPDETGASLGDLVTALSRRYKKTKKVNGAVALASLLDGRVGLVVQGYLKNFPAGHTLRRWQPGFTGGHAIFVYHGTDLKYHWYDPLAPMKFAGDIVSKADVLTFARGLGGSVTFKPDEYLPAPVVPPKTYTQAEMDAVKAQLAKASADLATRGAELAAAKAKIAAAKAALGG
jgi:hypothetical protein